MQHELLIMWPFNYALVDEIQMGPSVMTVWSTAIVTSLFRACLFFGMGANMNVQVYHHSEV